MAMLAIQTPRPLADYSFKPPNSEIPSPASRSWTCNPGTRNFNFREKRWLKNAIPGAEGLFYGMPIHTISRIQPETWAKGERIVKEI
jgi:hypothetical protein